QIVSWDGRGWPGRSRRRPRAGPQKVVDKGAKSPEKRAERASHLTLQSPVQILPVGGALLPRRLPIRIEGGGRSAPPTDVHSRVRRSGANRVDFAILMLLPALDIEGPSLIFYLGLLEVC